jgi:hypothetical protein
MNLLASVTQLLQVVATLLTFIAGYTSLLLLVLAYLIVADHVRKHSSLQRAYTVNSSSLDKCPSPEDEESVRTTSNSNLFEAFANFVHLRPGLLRRTH